MLPPGKGLLCNLNHVRLQHISLGLHLARHPQLRDSSADREEQKRCGGCGEGCGEVDANSNRPSLKCRCCASHAAPGDLPPPGTGDGAASPCDAASISTSTSSSSSAVSSCSELSPDSPVSVCYRGVAAEGSQCPPAPPRAVPADAAREGAGPRDGDPELSPALSSCGSLCSGCEETPPGTAVPEDADTRVDLDPNCNPLPGPGPAQPPPPAPDHRDRDRDLSSAAGPRPRDRGAPPPVPPRPKRRLQLLGARGAAPPEPGPGHLCEDAAKRSITSFHELAQRRRKTTAGRADRSDWLIVFSPDAELPPPGALLPGPEPPQLPPQPPERGPGQREVTTFRELRFRSAANKSRGRPPRRPPPPPGADGSGGALRTPAESPRAGGARRGAELPPRSPAGGPSCGRTAWIRSPGEGARDAERGHSSCEEAAPPPSAAGAPGAAQPRGDSADGHRAALAEQKRALLIAVSAAVDKVIAHFSAARNVVQKAQLGDSRLSPDVGHLVLHSLCPALCALVEDGLRPFQKDLITGQRRTSPWSVVEASVRAPGARSLQSLCWRVAALPPLSNTRQKFYAFVLGLLNTKQLELWISHLQSSTGVISVLYFPTAFFALSQGPLPHLAEELLLLLQPLSVLTFHLDLLFEHHHLSLDVRPLSRRLSPSPASPFARAAQPLEGRSSAAGGEDEAPPDVGGGAPSAEEPQCPAAPGTLQQRFWHALRWGDRLSRTLLGADGSAEPPRPGGDPWDVAPSGWWAQLGQASRIYAAPGKEGFPFTWWTKLRVAAADSSPGTTARPRTPPREPGGTELRLLQTKAIPELCSPTSSSGADTSGTSSPEALVSLSAAPSDLADAAAAAQPEAGGGRAASPAPGPSRCLGRLFGAKSRAARSGPPSPEASLGSRRPSRWLSPGARALATVVKALTANGGHPQVQPESSAPAPPLPHRAVRALCDHTGAADGHLSFQKGDVLQLLCTVDEDWIRCCHGNSIGLVPVGYTSLIV